MTGYDRLIAALWLWGLGLVGLGLLGAAADHGPALWRAFRVRLLEAHRAPRRRSW